MVVVAIIGLLASIGINKYNMNIMKARQAEAKLALGSIYGLQKSFYLEYASYIFAFDAIGYEPVGKKRFYLHAACQGGPAWAGTVSGYTGPIAVQTYSHLNMPWTYVWVPDPASTCNLGGDANCPSPDTTDPQSFTASAVGQICNGCYNDIWQIDENKKLANCSVGTH